MIGVTVLFLLLSGVAFLGYILNDLFYKIKITSVLPLMLIGLLIGPVFHLVNTSKTSTVVAVVPYITALAVSFLLFDVGLRIKIKDLGISYALKFTFALATATGVLLGIGIYLSTGMNVYLSFAAGFGLAGPSAVVIPTLMKTAKVNPKLKALLNFESVVVDTVTLIIPLLLIELLAQKSVGLGSLGRLFANFLIGSTAIGIISSFFWIFILHTFRSHSEEYSWMLTITMVIATYGLAQAFGASGAVAVFIFGLILANTQEMGKAIKQYTASMQKMISHISRFQKEVVFFVSTFFFVYIGLLFKISANDLWLLLISALLTIIIYFVRSMFIPMIKLTFEEKEEGAEHTIARFSIARGLSPIVVATLPAAYGVRAPSKFVDLLFLSVLITNIVTTYGMYLFAKQHTKSGQAQKKPEKS
jgi:NhaP-type Na+/H+ or K+/H+ antiporter